jgi:hypothetical protein
MQCCSQYYIQTLVPACSLIQLQLRRARFFIKCGIVQLSAAPRSRDVSIPVSAGTMRLYEQSCNVSPSLRAVLSEQLDRSKATPTAVHFVLVQDVCCYYDTHFSF